MSSLKIEGKKINKRGRLANAREDIPFGIYGIDRVKLKHGLLSVIRLSNKKKVNEFPNCKLSPTLQSAIEQCLLGNCPDVTQLSSTDHYFLQRLIGRSHVSNISLPRLNPNASLRCSCQTLPTIKKLQHQLSLNLGEIQSGNNSMLLLGDTLHIVKSLLSQDKISLSNASDIVKAFELEEKQISD